MSVTDDPEATVAIRPEPGVVCAAALPSLDGYVLTIRPRRRDDDEPRTAFDPLGVDDNDPALTALLLEGGVGDQLMCLHRLDRTLVVADGRAAVVGDPLSDEGTADLASALGRLCARPALLARRVDRLFRRIGGALEGERWNTRDFRVALPTSPAVWVDWPRVPGVGLATRLHVDAVGDEGWDVVDTARGAPPTGPTAPLDLGDAHPGRFVVVAPTDDLVAAALARLGPARTVLADALPHQVRVGASGVDVLYAGFEEEWVALEPAIRLAQALAIDAIVAVGPYR